MRFEYVNPVRQAWADLGACDPAAVALVAAVAVAAIFATWAR